MAVKWIVAGSSGLVGTALVAALESAGDVVVRLRRSDAKPQATQTGDPSPVWDPARGVLGDGVLDGADVVVNLAGESIGARRWTRDQKERIVSSRESATSVLARRIAGQKDKPTLVNASAVGIYGDGGDAVLSEASPPGQGFLADVCRRWEAATLPAVDAGGRVVLARLGVVLSPSGGALAAQLPLFRHGLGGRLGGGAQYVSWVAIGDAVGAIVHLAKNARIDGPVNVTAPEPVTNRQFTEALADVCGKPARLAVPAAALQVRFGSEMARELLLAGQRAVPQRLEETGYAFSFASLRPALGSLLH